MNKKIVDESNITKLFDWAYEKSLQGLPKMETAIELAESYKKEGKTLTENINSLIRWQITKTSVSGFLTGIGGLATLPFAIPVNIASVIYVQIRMISAIAYMAGYDIKDEKVKGYVLLCLVGNGVKDVLKEVGMQVGNKIAISTIRKYITTELLREINRAVGFRLVAKFGGVGIINIGKAIPLVGGIVGGSFDAITTNIIGNVARELFVEEVAGENGNDILIKSELQRFYCYINLIKKDKNIVSEELNLLYKYIYASDLPNDLQHEILNKLNSKELISLNFDLLKRNVVSPLEFIEQLIELAQIDFDIHESEIAYIHEIAKEFNIEEESYKDKFKERNFQYLAPEGILLKINYDRLLRHIESNIQIYFDDDSGIKIPVNDLIKFGRDNNIFLNVEKKWEGSDYITQVDIKNFKLFDNVTVKLIKSFNIILGYNGLGKTSLLQAISIGLLSQTSNASSKPDEYKEYIKKDTEFAEINIYYENEQRQVRVENSGLLAVKNSQLSKNLLLSYGVNLNSEMKDEEAERFFEYLLNGKDDVYSTKSIFKDNSNNFQNPLNVLYKLQKEETNLANSISELLIDTLNKFLKLISENETITIEKQGNKIFFRDFAGTHLDLKNLSEGYKDHILLISDIVMRIIAARNTVLEQLNAPVNSDLLLKAKGIILIDEFDRHLHPSWQRKLLSQLKETFPNIQFVLSTHNIVSLQSAEGEKIFVMSVENGKVSIKDGNIPIGYSIEALYEYYFDEHAYSVKITEKLSRFKEHRNKILATKDFSIMESGEFIELSNQLSKTNSQLATFVNIELFQLDKYKNNAQTN